jgi:phosphoglycolate phosphatase
MQLFFDFDGTLADSSPGIHASFEHACSCQELTAPPYTAFCAAIGPPVQELALRFFPQLGPAELELFRQTFRQDYDQDRFRLCQWFDGVEPTLLALSEIPGARLAIITNKPTIPTVELLKVAGLLRYFEIVVGIDFQVIEGSGPMFTQKSEAIYLAKSRLPVNTPIGFYIGDTPSDKRASLDCGLEFIAATYGFHCWQDADLNGISHLASINDLIPCLQEAVWRQQAHFLSPRLLT